MSSLKDERIVEMSFDNKNFEKNVKTSMNTIDQLKSSLNFSGISSSMKNSLGSVDTSSISEGLLTAGKNFSAMEIIAITALANITNKIIDMGLELVKSLTIDNIMAGWDKYAEKTTSVATLMAQGYDMDTINEQLAKLLWFTDETSYNFTDMVSNIGKFTASGQDLDSSVQAMMGIANWAALSGQNADVASRAMYQLAQAMSQGSVKLQDWKSIQNANMDTKEFRQNALDAAVAAGELIQNIDGTYTTKKGNIFDINQFTQFLTSDEWLTTDVLMDTLGKYSSAVNDLYDAVESDDSINTTSEAIAKYGDSLDEFGLKAFKAAQEAKTFKDAINATKDAVATQWMGTFEHIFGQYDKAKVLWTDLANELYESFASGLAINNQILSKWNELGGRDDLFANTDEQTGAFWNLFYAIREINNLIKNAWRTIFPFSQMEEGEERIDDIANKLKGFTGWLKEATSKLYLSEGAAETFTNILRGAFSMLKAFFKIIGAIWTGIKPVLSAVMSLAGQLFTLFGKAGNSFANFIDKTTMFAVAGQKVANVLTIIINEITSLNIIGNIIKILNTLSSSFVKNGGTASNFGRILNGVKSIILLLVDAFGVLWQFAKTYIFPLFWTLLDFAAMLVGAFGGKIVAAFAWIGDVIVMFVNFIRTSETVKKVVGAVGKAFAYLLTAMTNFFGSFRKVDTTGLDEFNENTVEKFDPLTAVLSALSSLFNGLWSILKAILPFLTKAIDFVGKLLVGFAKNVTGAFGGDGGINLIDILSMGFLILVAKRISDVIYIFQGIANAITDVFGGLADVLYSKALMQYAEAMKTMAIAIIILVAALILISMMDDEQLKRSMTVLIVILSAFAAMMAIMKKIIGVADKLGVKSVMTAFSMKLMAESIMKIAISVAILVLALKILGSMSKEQIQQGLSAIIMLMVVLLGAAAIIGKGQKVFKKGARGLIGMALAVLLLSIPLKSLGKMDPKQLLQGIIGITALVGLCILFAKISGSVKKAVLTSMGMIMFAEALILASLALRIIGGMGWSKLAVGMVGIVSLAGVMVLLGTMSKQMKKALPAAIAMIMISESLILASLALRIIGGMGWSKLLIGMIGLLSIAGIIILLGTMSKQMKKALPAAMAMILMSEALILASLALRIIGGMGWSKLVVGMAGILGIAGVMILLGTMSKFMKKTLITAMSMVLIGVAMTEFALATALLGSMKWQTLLKAGIAMLGITGVMVLIGSLFKAKMIVAIMGFGAALMMISTALLAFSIAVALLNLNSWSNLGKALLILIGVLIIFAGASLVLAKVIPVMLGLGAAMFLFGAALLMISIALTIIIVTLGIFGSALTGMLKLVASAIIQAAPMIAIAIGALLSAIFQGLTMAVKELFVLLNVLIVEILNFLWAHGPRIIETVVMLLAELLAAIAAYFPNMMESIISMVITLLEALRENIGEIINIVIDILLNLLQAIIDRFPEIMTKLVDLIIAIIDGIIAALKKLVPKILNGVIDVILIVIRGMTDAIKRLPEIFNALFRFLEELCYQFGYFIGRLGPELLKIGIALIKGIINGLWEGIKNIGNVIKDIGGKIVSGFKSFFGINSPSKVFAEIGGFLDDGLVQGIEDNADNVYDSLDSLSDNMTDTIEDSGMQNAIQQLYNSLNQDMDGEFVIRPVFDLEEIQNGKNEIYALMKDTKGFDLNGSDEIAKKTANSMNNRKKEKIGEDSGSNKNKQKEEEKIIFNNTYNITESSDPKRTAEEISIHQQKMINRRKQQYGKPNI